MTFVFPNDIYTCTCNLLASSFLGLFWIANGTMYAYYHLNIFNRNGRKCRDVKTKTLYEKGWDGTNKWSVSLKNHFHIT